MLHKAAEHARYITPAELANRWRKHPETIRRQLRAREIASVVIGRRRLIPLGEVLRIEADGLIPAATPTAQKSSQPA
jgi:hypothetical protein